MAAKTAAKTAAKKPSLAEAGPEQRFWVCDGQVFGTLKELGAGLDKMDDLIWRYHVNSQKNDFANWIEGVFGEKKLGLAVRNSKNAKAAAKKVKARVAGSKLWSFL